MKLLNLTLKMLNIKALKYIENLNGIFRTELNWWIELWINLNLEFELIWIDLRDLRKLNTLPFKSFNIYTILENRYIWNEMIFGFEV